ncbi:ankyrin repeat domain-containing protein 26 [Fundulus diaphanus]
MKKIFSFTKKKKHPSGTPDNASALSDGYDLKDKDLGKIHKAALQNDLAKLKQLVKKNDINQLDKENRSALHIACATGHAEAVQFLIDSKAKLDLRDNQNRSALMKAVQGQHEDIVNLLLENRADPNLADINGNTALHLAANIPSISTAVLLLQHGAEIDAQNKEGFTPLTVAVREDRIEMAQFLLKERADVNSLDQDERSPLMLAASGGQHGMVKLLLQFDPDITLQDSKGWSADDYAGKNGHHSCCLLITEHGTKRTHGASASHPGPSKKKRTLGVPSQEVEAGFSLGGPAIDKEHGANQAGRDFEDNSLSESVSRASKSANDEWPSTDDEEESVEKKPLKVNLSRIFGSKMEEAPALPSLSDTESEPECKTSVQRIPPSPTAQPPAYLPPVPSLPKSPQAASTPPLGSRQVNVSQVKHEVDDAAEESGKADAANAELSSPSRAPPREMQATLDVAEDCIVSAIRVESKLSDEEESFATRSSGQRMNASQSSTGGPIPAGPGKATQSPGGVKEAETEDDDGDSLSDEQNSGGKGWHDTDDEEEKTEGVGGGALVACPSKLLAKVGKNPESDVEEDPSSGRESVKGGQRRSSWGSSVEGGEVDTPTESEANNEVLQQGNEVQALDMQLKATVLPPKEEQPETPRDSSSAAPVSTRRVSPQAENKPSGATAHESDCDSSEADKQTDPGAKRNAASPAAVNTDGETKETHKCSSEGEEEDNIEKESREGTNKQILGDGEPAASAWRTDEERENEEGDSSSWDDHDESDDLEKQMTTPHPETSLPSLAPEHRRSADREEAEKRKTCSVQTGGDDEGIPCSLIDGHYDAEEDAPAQAAKLAVDEIQSEGDESSEDSDSKHQKLQYDFASATVKLLDGGGGSAGPAGLRAHVGGKSVDESEARLTSYAPLEDETVSATRTGEPCDGGPRRETVSSSPPSNETDASGQRRSSEVSDEALPQTDIDDVDLSSPERSENTSPRWHELKSADEAEVQEQNSTEDERDNNEEEEQEFNGDDEGDTSHVDNQSEDGGELHGGASAAHDAEVGKDKKRDFRSELGLEKGEEESSWDSESNSELSNIPHKEEHDLDGLHLEETSAVEEPLKENMFYIPSFLRGKGGSRMAELEPRKSAGMPQGSQGEAGGNSSDNRGSIAHEDNTLQIKKESPKREPLSVFSKPKEDADIMEELGVGDVDDLEDGSDWDSASTISKRTLPGRKMPSSGFEEFQEDGNPSGSAQKEEPALPPPSTPQRSSSSGTSQPSTPSKSAPQPQPRARKAILQQPDSKEESDCEQEKTRSAQEASPPDNKLQNVPEPPAVVEPGMAELSLMAGHAKGGLDSEEQQEKEKDDAVDGCGLSLRSLGHAGSDAAERDDDRPGERLGGDTPWENRYEKLWVEVEKREVKSTYKSVAAELKERFGELSESGCPAGDPPEDATPASSSADEESSDEGEGEVIVRPAARARSAVLLTIPEQRESGQEESVAESPDSSLCDERLAAAGVVRRRSAPLTADAVGAAAPSQLPAAQEQSEGHADRHARPFSKDSAGTSPAADSVAHLHGAGGSGAGSEGEVEESPMPEPASRDTRPVVSSGEGRGEEDVTKFNPETGSTAAAAATVEEQKCGTSWDGGDTAVEKIVSSKKPETALGSLLNRADGSDQDQQPVPAQSASRAPVQHSCGSKKQERPAVEGTLQLEPKVRGARPGRAPQTSKRVNGDPSSVFDDSSLSDLSDDGIYAVCRFSTSLCSTNPFSVVNLKARCIKHRCNIEAATALKQVQLTTRGQQRSKIQTPEEMDMAEDLDELTQSSDTATDDMDSPTSGYRHASLLIQKLDSSTLDSTSITKLQNIFHEYERSIEKGRSRHGYLAEKVSQLGVERAALKSSLEEVKDVKSLLERNQLELQTEVTNLKFQLKQEQENRHNATMMYNTTRDKLRRMEEQHQFEVEERQKVELTLRNLELETRTLIGNMKQLEEEHSETQRLLAQERSSRALQENLLSSHLRKQQEMEAENRRSVSRSNEALSQLTEASDRERELLQQNTSLQEQLSMLRTDFERSQASSSLKESHLVEENETLKEQLEDVRRDLKLSNEAVTQTVFTCNAQLATLKSELAKTASRLENERQAREALEAEAESTRGRLAGAVKEAELRLAAHSDAEKALLREKEEHQRLRDRLTGELASQREDVSSLSQKLAKAEARANSMENEVHRVTLQLTEKGLLLDVLQREKDQAAARGKELENALQAAREQGSRAGARHEAAQERLAQAQSEAMLLRQQLEESQNKGDAKERAVTDAQERFSDILSKLRSDCEERVQLVEDRNKELASKAADLRDQIYKLEEEKNERETSVRQLQQELADSLKKLSMSEASLEVNTRYRSDLEEEKARLLKDCDRLRGKLEESEDQYVQAERRINGLKSSLGEREKELSSASQKLQEALSASAASEITIKQLEEAVQRLEIENARLEAAAKQQSNKIEALQKGAQEAAMLTDCSPGGGVRGHLEDLVTNLQSSKMTLEEQLNKEVQRQSMLSHTAQDSQALWEEELKSRSKLGLRLAELEKEKGELTAQMEMEKKKAKKVAEQKKAVDARLDQEMKRNVELQKEMYRLRTLLKTAKKKLRDHEAGGGEFASPMNSLRMDLGRHHQADGAFGWMKDKVEDLQGQLEKETSRRDQLEKLNEELKDQVASLKGSGRRNDELERGKRQLEEEVLELRRRMEAAQTGQSQADRYRHEAEEKARQEIQQKLEQVNLFLQSQAASQEALDQIKAANEANLRSQLEQKIRELEGELGRARSGQLDSLNQKESTRSELERYRELYTEEMRLRKSLAAKLERANSRLAEANSKLLSERSRSLIAGNMTNGSLVGPSLDLSSLGSPANPGATLGSLNRGFGFPLLSPVPDGPNRRVEDYLAKMQSELDKNISKELSNAAAELDAASTRLSPVGSASGVELDPVSRAAQQYLEVLKKNHRI